MRAPPSCSHSPGPGQQGAAGRCMEETSARAKPRTSLLGTLTLAAAPVPGCTVRPQSTLQDQLSRPFSTVYLVFCYLSPSSMATLCPKSTSQNSCSNKNTGNQNNRCPAVGAAWKTGVHSNLQWSASASLSPLKTIY
jgi:hypothetical protein